MRLILLDSSFMRPGEVEHSAIKARQTTSLSVLKSFNIIIVDKVAGFDAGYYRHMFSLLFLTQDIPSHLSDYFFLRILWWIYQLRIFNAEYCCRYFSSKCSDWVTLWKLLM